MGWISVLFVHKAIEEAGAQRSRLQMVGIDPDVPLDPKQMITDEDFFRLLESIAAEQEDGRSAPIRMGAAMRCDDYGAFGLAFKSASDLLGSYARVERFGKVVTSIANFRVTTSGSSVLMEVIPGQQQRLGLTMTNELALAAALALSREVSSDDFALKALHMTGAKPEDDTAYRAHFRCPIRYRAERDALEVDALVAARPNRLADQGISTFFEAHLEDELSEMRTDTLFARRVLDQIGDRLSEGVPALAETANRLGMSSRTLQRRLSEAGLAYQDLVSEARNTLAQQLLRRTDYGLAEIAFLTGFADQSTFSRAFKRWHGQTPASYRRDA